MVVFFKVKPLDHTVSIVPFEGNFRLFMSAVCVPDWLHLVERQQYLRYFAQSQVLPLYLSTVEVFLCCLSGFPLGTRT